MLLHIHLISLFCEGPSNTCNSLGREKWKWLISTIASNELSSWQLGFYCFVRNKNIFIGVAF